MSAFSSAIDQALATVNDVAGEDVVYVQGETSIELKGVPASGSEQREDVNEVSIAYSDRDWIFKASDLVDDDDARITPRRGDQVRWTTAGVTTVFEVVPDGDQPYRYSDRARTRIRVHTKEMTAA